MIKKKLITVLVPVFNEEKNVNFFYEKIKKIIKVEKNYQFEILFLNNCSTDNTFRNIKKISKFDRKVKLISYSKNFGRNNSIFGGLKNSNGDYIFLIDVDCQDPPEFLHMFLRKAEHGYKVIYGKRDRRNESLIYSILGKAYYRLLHLLSDSDFIIDMAEFCLIHKDVKNAIININNDKPFVRAEIAHVGFSRIGISYLRAKRVHEKSKYNFFQLFYYSFSGFISVSTILLRIVALGGLFLIIYNFLYLIINNNFYINEINNIFIIFSIIIISIYLARSHNNIISRKNYVIDMENSINVQRTK